MKLDYVLVAPVCHFDPQAAVFRSPTAEKSLFNFYLS